MSVHIFRCYIGKGKMSVSDLETRIDDWVSSNAEWENDNTPHDLSEVNTQMDDSGTTYYSIDVRFLKDNAKSNLLQKFTDKLKDKVSWYRVGYHVCDHDGVDEQGIVCSFDPQENSEAMAERWTGKDVTIPSDIPDFPSEAYN